MPYADLAALTGTLTGTLGSGDPVNNPFYQAGYTGSECSEWTSCDGTVTLVEATSLPTLPPLSQLTLVASMMVFGVWMWRRRDGEA